MADFDSWGKQKPGDRHKWRTGKEESKPPGSTDKSDLKMTCKATLVCTLPEYRTIRARALRAHMSVSQFLRTHFPAELLLPLND